MRAVDLAEQVPHRVAGDRGANRCPNDRRGCLARSHRLRERRFTAHGPGGSQVLRFLIPPYIQDDPALARVYDDSSAERLLGKLSSKLVSDLLPRRQDRDDLPVVDGNATTMEIAAVMARLHSPVVAVLEQGRVVGAVTVSRLFNHLFPDVPPIEDPSA